MTSRHPESPGPAWAVKYILEALAALVFSAGMTASAGTTASGESLAVSVFVDIRPGLCPNHLRLESPLTIPVAILGTMDLEAAMVDPATARLSREGAEGELGDEIGLLSCKSGGPEQGEFEFAYYTTVSDRVTFTIYDVKGRVVARLVDMDMSPGIYNAVWEGITTDLCKAPAGIYFARVSTTWAWDMYKITVP